MKILPLLNPYLNSYEQWSTRTATHEEMLEIYKNTGQFQTHINDRLLATITNPLEAAIHMANVGVDNGLGHHIDEGLEFRSQINTWLNLMPAKTPKEISKYQEAYPDCDFNKVNDEINNIGVKLSPGQFLFHGGVWPGGQHFIAERPLSTSFCPQVALRESEHRGKSYDAGRIDLFVLHVAESATNVFVYPQKGTNFGHEKEVLFATGAHLRLCRETLIRNDYKAYKANGFNAINRDIPFYVLEVEIS